MPRKKSKAVRVITFKSASMNMHVRYEKTPSKWIKPTPKSKALKNSKVVRALSFKRGSKNMHVRFEKTSSGKYIKTTLNSRTIEKIEEDENMDKPSSVRRCLFF